MIAKINILKIEVFLLLTAIILLLIGFMLYPVVSYDSGYYMSIMRDMHLGNIYFKDIASPYNPLGIGLLSLPFYFTNLPDFRWSLLINVFFIMTSSMLLYNIFTWLKIHKLLRLFLSLFFITLCFTHDGNHIMLEPISVFFQLSGLFIYLKQRPLYNPIKLLLVGICIGLSFLTKQYALFILLPIGVDILLSRKSFLKKTICLSIGVLIPIIILYLYYYLQDMSSLTYIKCILGKGIDLDIGTGTGVNNNFKFSHFIDFLFVNAFIVLIPFLLKNKASNKQDVIFYVLLAFSSFLVFFFASFNHYFIYVFPYFLILFAYAASFTKELLKNPVFIALSLIALLKISLLTGSTFKHQFKDYKEQTHNQKVIENHIQKNSRVYLNGVSPAYYYLCEFKSIDLNQIGFSFPGYFYPQTIINAMNSNDYLVITQDYIQEFEPYQGLFKIKEVQLRDYSFYLFQKK